MGPNAQRNVNSKFEYNLLQDLKKITIVSIRMCKNLKVGYNVTKRLYNQNSLQNNNFARIQWAEKVNRHSNCQRYTAGLSGI